MRECLLEEVALSWIRLIAWEWRNLLAVAVVVVYGCRERSPISSNSIDAARF